MTYQQNIKHVELKLYANFEKYLNYLGDFL